MVGSIALDDRDDNRDPTRLYYAPKVRDAVSVFQGIEALRQINECVRG